MHPLLRYVLVATPLAILAFLLLSDVHRAWDGHVVSIRPVPEGGSVTRTVLIVDDDRHGTEAVWPTEFVEGLPVQVDPTATPPLTIPDDAARTQKPRWSLWFTVQPNGGSARAIPTYSARTLSVALLLWMVGLAIHNMLRSGSPFSWVRGDLSLPASQPTTGQAPAPSATKARSRKGPPPPRRRRGAGRRR